MATEIPKPSFSQVVKHPGIYYMLVAISVMWYFVYKFGGASGLVNENCEKEKIEWKSAFDQERTKNDVLTTALLVKNGIILKQEQEKKDFDSTLRKKVGQKAIQIIKEK